MAVESIGVKRLVVPIDKERLVKTVKERVFDLLPIRYKEIDIDKLLERIIEIGINWADGYCRGIYKFLLNIDVPIEMPEQYFECVVENAVKYIDNFLIKRLFK